MGQAKPFRCANGWYVAEEGAQGTHYQPDGGGHMSRTEAEAYARLLNGEAPEPGDEAMVCTCDRTYPSRCRLHR